MWPDCCVVTLIPRYVCQKLVSTQDEAAHAELAVAF